jgi:hypothetical protein
MRRELGRWLEIAESLEGLARLAGDGGRMERAARLLGAAEAIRDALGAPLPPVRRAEYEQCVAEARAALGEEALAAAWAQGKALSVDQAIADALDGGPGSCGEQQATSTPA